MAKYPPCVDGAILAEHLSSLPPSHPARNEGSLTQIQQAYLPALLWLFDTDRFRAQGRSYLLAYVAIELAMRGNDVSLDDYTVEMTRSTTYSRHTQARFIDQVFRIAQQQFPEHRFAFDHRDRVLLYRGRHPK